MLQSTPLWDGKILRFHEIFWAPLSLSISLSLSFSLSFSLSLSLYEMESKSCAARFIFHPDQLHQHAPNCIWDHASSFSRTMKHTSIAIPIQLLNSVFTLALPSAPRQPGWCSFSLTLLRQITRAAEPWAFPTGIQRHQRTAKTRPQPGQQRFGLSGILGSVLRKRWLLLILVIGLVRFSNVVPAVIVCKCIVACPNEGSTWPRFSTAC